MKRKILAISGSVRKNSTNEHLIHAIGKMLEGRYDLEFYGGIGSLPLFNPDHQGPEPEELDNFRKKLREADAILISTPEYAHGVPGSLKNAIDWTVATMEFSHKPTLLITASTDGRYGHQALLETLKVLEAANLDELQLLISFAKTKIAPDGTIVHQKTKGEIQQLLGRLERILNGEAAILDGPGRSVVQAGK